ncbi:unnamed protein product [Adineta ricciae]|uniref:Uncharacterized protein n=1 Tax=Adineta ricciae TaxID=249248 RepID=A0A813TR18_ADIRI|nr:unnamed protein product [Adineta ricciae]CAF1319704.1 unnamed protein product [Adineta ricciae]
MFEENPRLKKGLIIGGVAVVAAVAAPLAIIPALGAAGFTSAGVAAGSVAAYFQTATTVSGSLFALCQSAGAVGAVATSTSIGVGVTAAAAAGGVTAAVCRNLGGNRVDVAVQTDEDEDAPDEVDILFDERSN